MLSLSCACRQSCGLTVFRVVGVLVSPTSAVNVLCKLLGLLAAAFSVQQAKGLQTACAMPAAAESRGMTDKWHHLDYTYMGGNWARFDCTITRKAYLDRRSGKVKADTGAYKIGSLLTAHAKKSSACVHN